MLRSSARASSSDASPTARAMSARWRVTYVAVSFLSTQRGALASASCTSPMFLSYVHRKKAKKMHISSTHIPNTGKAV